VQATSPGANGAVDYVAPETLSEALRILHQHGEAASVLAGGQSLLVFLREELIAPRVLVSLKRVQELRALSFSVADGMHIGAMVTQAELERAQPVRDYYRALSEAASVVATVQVRNQGTIGGNLCHADPTADPPAALIALGARLEIAGLDGRRTLPVEEFFRDYMDVDLRTGEVLTKIVLPPPVRNSSSAYLKHRVRHVDTALVGAAAWLQLDDTTSLVQDVRIGLAGAGATPLRALEAEQVLRGAPLSHGKLAQCADAAAAGCDPLDDTEASAWYRREMVRTLVQRVLATCLARVEELL
jgi:aerobic carbon-monoxide dehydrogenase medium subunit